MVSRDEVLHTWREGGGFPAVGRRFGMTAGKAYMIATGIPADGSDSLAPEDHEREGLILGASQALLGVPNQNPTRPEQKSEVMAWVRARARADNARHAEDANEGTKR